MGNIKADFNQKEVSIEEEKSELKVNNRENSAYMRYHTSEIAQSEKILKTAIKITWVGFVVLVLGCIMGFTGKTGEAVVTSISAVVL